MAVVAPGMVVVALGVVVVIPGVVVVAPGVVVVAPTVVVKEFGKYTHNMPSLVVSKIRDAKVNFDILLTFFVDSKI